MSILKAVLALLSKLLRSTGLVLVLFSCPLVDAADELGVAFPASDVWLKTRFTGLLGDVRVREEGRGGAVLARPEERSANFALGGNGTANGDGVCGGLLVLPVKIVGCETVRFGDENGDGDSGDLGDELGDFLTRLNLDGDLESERLRDLTAEVTSTWCTCVGEGKVRVPPPLLE